MARSRSIDERSGTARLAVVDRSLVDAVSMGLGVDEFQVSQTASREELDGFQEVLKYLVNASDSSKVSVKPSKMSTTLCHNSRDSVDFVPSMEEQVEPRDFADASRMVDVEEPAQLVRGPQDTTALVGDRVLLKATYIGRPEPSVKWTRAVS